MKVIIHQMKQRTDEWYSSRIGKLGGSETKDIVDIKKKMQLKSKSTVMTAVYKVVSEILTGKTEPSFTNAAMQWGIDNEDAAAEPLINDRSFFPGGITRSDLPHVWLSPDMLEYGEGDNEFNLTAGYEFKCPTSKVFVKYVDAKKVPNEHIVQCLMYFVMIPTLETVKLHCFDPRIKGKKRVEFLLTRKEYKEHIENMEASLIEFCAMIDETLKLFQEDENAEV